MELLNFELNWSSDLNFCFCFPDQGCNVPGDQGIQTVVEVFRKLSRQVLEFGLAAVEALLDLMIAGLDCSPH